MFVPNNQMHFPIIITHGWPGSIFEELKLIGPLTDPVAYGGKAEDAFDVVIPAMPGYGFSGKPTTPAGILIALPVHGIH
jgi:pimeloyl-ACP methyl ester carboxylesterase